MSQHVRHIVMAAVVLMSTALSAWGGNVMFKAKLDSATLLMGKTTTLHLEITQDKDARGFFPGEQSDTLSAMIEIAGRPAADTTDLGNNRIQINRDLIIQSFDSGMWVIKPIPYVVNGDTAYCNQLALKVLPVDVSQMQDIHDIKPVEGVPFNLFDWLPDYWWAWLLGLLLIGGGIWAYRKYYKQGINPLKPTKKRLPAYEEAMINLQNLKAAQLWQQGHRHAQGEQRDSGGERAVGDDSRDRRYREVCQCASAGR